MSLPCDLGRLFLNVSFRNCPEMLEYKQALNEPNNEGAGDMVILFIYCALPLSHASSACVRDGLNMEDVAIFYFLKK